MSNIAFIITPFDDFAIINVYVPLMAKHILDW